MLASRGRQRISPEHVPDRFRGVHEPQASIRPRDADPRCAGGRTIIWAGSLTDLWGKTQLRSKTSPQSGEVTHQAASHGANRLASNSLLEAVVFAARIAENIKGMLPEAKITDWGKNAGENDDPVTLEDSPSLTRLRRTMSDNVGVIRSRDSLVRAIREISALERGNTRLRLTNILTTAKLITAAAYLRTESRGGHYRSDCPETVASWKHRTFITLAEADRVIAEVADMAVA